MLAGNARVTLVSKRTGARYTYRVRRAENDARLWFVSLLTGSDNESDYAYLGLVRREAHSEQIRFQLTAKSKMGDGSKPVAGFRYALDRIYGRKEIPAELEVWHEGACGRCRPLTVPESIERGIGPDCAETMGIA